MKKTIKELLGVAEKISRGEIPEYQHNEYFTSGAFDLLLLNVNEVDAFELLVDLCGQFESIASESTDLKGFYLLVSQLAHRTKTTEMPEGMEKVIKFNPNLSEELSQWYRYNG